MNKLTQIKGFSHYRLDDNGRIYSDLRPGPHKKDAVTSFALMRPSLKRALLGDDGICHRMTTARLLFAVRKGINPVDIPSDVRIAGDSITSQSDLIARVANATRARQIRMSVDESLTDIESQIILLSKQRNALLTNNYSYLTSELMSNREHAIAVISKMLKSATARNDVIDNAIASVYERIAVYHRPVSNIRAYLVATAKNLCKQVVAERKKMKHTDDYCNRSID